MHRGALDEPTRVLAAHRAPRDVAVGDRAERAQHLHLLVAHGLVVEGGRRLHRDEGEELQQVVLHDVAHRAGLFVVPGAFLDADRLGDRDLDMIDVLTVPEGLEDPVREAHDEDVLDRLFSEVVVDAEDLVLAEDLMDELGERARRLAIVAEGLLDDDPRPAGPPTEAMSSDRLHDGLVRAGRGCQVEEPVRVRPELGVQLVEAAGELVVPALVRRRDEEHMVGEALPHLLVDRLRAAVLAHRPVQLLAELVVGERLPRGADDREAAGEQALKREVVEGGHELALHEIARATEDDDRRRLRRARQAQAFAKRIDDGRRH